MLTSVLQTTRSIPLRLSVLGAILFFHLSLASAQVSTARPLTVQQLTTRLDTLKAADAAKGPDIDAAVAALADALTVAQEREAFVAQRIEYERKIASAPKDLVAVQAALEKANEEVEPKEAAGITPLKEAEAEQAKTTAALKAARKAVDDLTEEQTQSRERSNQIPDQTAALAAERDSLSVEGQPPPTAPELQKAQFERNLQRRMALSDQLLKLDAERNFYEATNELLMKRIELANRQVARLTRESEYWREEVNKARAAAADDDLKKANAQKEQFAAIAALRSYTAETAELAERRKLIAADIDKLSGEKKAVESKYNTIRDDRQNSLRRIELFESAGLEMLPKISELLAKEKKELTKPQDLQSKLRAGLNKSAQAEIELFEDTEEAQRLAAEREQEIGLLEVKAEREAKAANIEYTKNSAEALVKDRREILASLIQENRKYVALMAETNRITKLTLDEATEYHRFLDERLLWAPNMGKLTLQSFDNGFTAVVSFFQMQSQPWLESLALQLPACIVIGILAGAILAGRRKFSSLLTAKGEAAALRRCTSFVPTVEALGLTLLLALPFPLLLGALAWLGDDGEIANGLKYATYFSALVGFAFVCSRPTGLLESHFKIESARVGYLRRHLKWFFPVALPVMFFTGAFSQGNSEGGRLFFFLLMLIIAVLALQLLRPGAQLVFSKGKPSANKVGLAIALIVPVALSTGAALGYFSSMIALRLLIMKSFWLVVLGWVLTRLMLRWILVSRRRLAIEQALRRREAYLAEREKSTDPDRKAGAVSTLEEVKAEAVDVVEVEEQTARLTRALVTTAMAVGLWAIWAPTLPALSVLKGITVWGETIPAAAKTAATASGTSLLTGLSAPSESSTGAPQTSALPEIIRPTSGGVSLQDVFVAIAILALTFVAASNVPGLLELTLLRRINLEPGGNFAVTTTVRYVIVLAGILLAFGKIGISWSNVQWIAAAVTVGIGFGLQEVFANFVAGLIVLFERPIRLGDIVTIGNASGKVTKIQIRATTVLQFNNRELIVPNKDLITGTLINWTLSDGILRIEVPVGIAYGSDTEKAREILLKIAQENPRLRKEPKPDVLFSAFGTSSLDFQLRAHVSVIDDLLPAKNEIFFAVEKEFREAGIEIAFPQTDIHIRSVPDGFQLPDRRPAD
ncbi:MAG: mechanosensitive ion channel [Verrucomicrobiae bacterium]|nr:mechanosensitive ion channel [Verrucomicrobiae bacterium]